MLFSTTAKFCVALGELQHRLLVDQEVFANVVDSLTVQVSDFFRDPIFYGKIPPASHLTVAALLAIGLFALGAFAFIRTSRRITLYL